jgi:hypothetical protein
MITRDYPADWQVLLMDLRGHGATPRLNVETLLSSEDDSTQIIFRAAEDIAHTCEVIGQPPPEIVCGHSLGGKVALAYLQSCLEGKFAHFWSQGGHLAPRSTWILDTIPSALERADDAGVSAVLSAVEHVDMEMRKPGSVITSKEGIAAALAAHGCSPATSSWLLTSVEPCPPTAPGACPFRFAYDLPTCRSLYSSYAEVNFLPLVSRIATGGACDSPPQNAYETNGVFAFGGSVNVPLGCTLDMIRAGANTGAWPESVLVPLQKACVTVPPISSNSRLHLLRNSGHNVHIDDPKGLLSLMRSSLESITGHVQ